MLYILRGKAKLRCKPVVCDGEDLQVVQSCKDALFCNAETSCQDSKLQVVIGFKRLAEQVPYQGDHFVVIAVVPRLVQRNVIFVNQENYFLAIMLPEQAGQGVKAVSKHIIRHGIHLTSVRVCCCQLPVASLFFIVQFRAILEKTEPESFISNNNAEHGLRPGKVHGAYSFQGNRYYRKFSHVFFTIARFSADFQSLEQFAVTPIFEEIAEHIHIQGLPEPPGTGEEVYFSPIFQQFFNESCLVYIVKAFGSHFFEVFNAYRQFNVLIHTNNPFALKPVRGFPPGHSTAPVPHDCQSEPVQLSA